jgi:hypothetical protein
MAVQMHLDHFLLEFLRVSTTLLSAILGVLTRRRFGGCLVKSNLDFVCERCLLTSYLMEDRRHGRLGRARDRVCDFPDQRLKTRFGKLLGQLGELICMPLPAACQDWAATEATYRFFDTPASTKASV